MPSHRTVVPGEGSNADSPNWSFVERRVGARWTISNRERKTDRVSRSQQASRTAAGVAWLRAAHQVVDSPPRILDDPIAPALFGDAAAHLAERGPELFSPGALALRSHVLLRSRFAEDQLAAAVRRGGGQYVILGAGFDTFGYRQPSWARTLRIIEVDQPVSQQDKRRRLADAGIVPPANLIFAAVDFEAESLIDELARTGVDVSAPTFFSWLGVSMYLTRDAVDAVFRTVARFPSSSELVFTFAQPRPPGSPTTPSIVDPEAAVGEPWLIVFDPDELPRILREDGFSSVRF